RSLDRLGNGLADQLLGTAAGWRSRLPIAAKPHAPRGQDQRHRLRKGRRRLRQPLRHASAVSDRWQLRRNRRYCGNAAPVADGRDSPPAGTAQSLERRVGPGPACPRELYGRYRVEEWRVGIGDAAFARRDESDGTVWVQDAGRHPGGKPSGASSLLIGYGRIAMIRTGAPVPPPIFIGRAINLAPGTGTRS